MRKVVIVVLILGTLAGGYYYVSKQRITIEALQGRVVKTHRGDLTIPITASGNIRPATITQIKSKASGEVIQIPFDVGQMVNKRDLVVALLEIDEKTAQLRALADYQRAVIEREKAEIAKRQAEQVGIPAAQAKLAQAQANFTRMEWEYKRQVELRDKKLGTSDGLGSLNSPLEFAVVQAQHDQAKAAMEGAQVDVEQARIAVDLAQKNIETAKQVEETAQRSLDDANQRLIETKVYSPIDGMVLAKNIQKGEVVQSGKTMFTGGTVLMEIADVSQIYAVVNVDEADIGQVRELAPPGARPGPAATQPATLPAGIIKEGEPVEVTVESFKDKRFFGVIERIAPQSEVVQAIAKFKVHIRITSDNRSDLVGLLNTQAEAHFSAKSVKNAILVSYDAMQKDPTGESFGVFVPLKEPGKARPEPKFQACKFGVDNGVEVEVISGLTDGQEVYTKLPMKTDREKKQEEATD